MTAAPVSGQPVVAIVGPTAAGKSDLAVELALRIGRAEIVNGDSMQLYTGMDVGTAKLPLANRRGVSHHLLDVWPVTKSAAVAEYQRLARTAIARIHRRGAVAILVGGSGLYLRAALDRVEFPGESPAIRSRLAAELAEFGPAQLHRRLAELDPDAAAHILTSNGRRIVRALEVIELTGGPFLARMPPFESVYPHLVQVGIDRGDLDERVEQRVYQMLSHGLVAEVRQLLAAGLRESPTAGKALGYAQVMRCLDAEGDVVGDLDSAAVATVGATRRFVRRQRSWFRRDPRVQWFDAADSQLIERVLVTLKL